MKKLILTLVLLTLRVGVFAQSALTRTDSEGNEIYRPLVLTANYQMYDFDLPKLSSVYGIGISCNSISHWGILHVGATVNYEINAGIVKNWSSIMDFGPSLRIDICKDIFFNMPLMCSWEYGKGESGDFESSWIFKTIPSINAFFTKRFGIFAGPMMTVGSKAVSWGFSAGLAIAI